MIILEIFGLIILPPIIAVIVTWAVLYDSHREFFHPTYEEQLERQKKMIDELCRK